MDAWDEGSGYEAYMGRWSRLMARQFLHWLQMPPGIDWLDVGCGTGALAAAILGAAEPHRVAGVDPSSGFIMAGRAGLGDGADLVVADARSLPLADRRFDATVSGLALNFVADPASAMHELRRVTRPDGMVAAYVWDYAGGMQMIRTFWDVAVGLRPSIAHLDEGTRFPLCDPDRLGELFRQSGLREVETTGLEISTSFANFDDYWTPLLGGQGPVPSYVMSLGERERADLRTNLEDALPAVDGRIPLSARAWAVRGVR